MARQVRLWRRRPRSRGPAFAARQRRDRWRALETIVPRRPQCPRTIGRTATYPLEARPEASGAPSVFGGSPPPATAAIRLTGGPSLFACFGTSLHHEEVAGRPSTLERIRGGRSLCLVALSYGDRGLAAAVLSSELWPLRLRMRGEAGGWAGDRSLLALEGRGYHGPD